MKIAGITKNINFTAGKVHVYTDFDGTYCPAKHSSLHIEGENTFMYQYCTKMDKFLKSTEGDIHLHVTTGRTFGEFEAISYLLNFRKFFLPLPESFISKNGSDEFIKDGTDADFYKKGIFPYKYSEPNKLKENEIKKLTNWDGINLRNFVRNLASRYKLNIIEADSENSVKDYGSNSLFSEGKLKPDEWKRLPNYNGKITEHSIPIADFVLGSRKDGNLKLNLIISPDYGFCPERNYIYDNFMNEIKNYLNSNNVKYSMDWEVPTKSNHYRNHCNISPKIEGLALSKLYDAKCSLKDAIKNNDMVIVAGDGSNDFNMLNPFEYIEQSDWEKYKSNSECKYFYDADMNQKLSYIRDAYEGRNDKLRQELESNGLIKQIRELPLFSVIVGKENNSLRILKDTFERFGKIITVENTNLDKGIKDAIKEYASNKDSFKESMSNKLKKYILGITTKKKDNKNAVIYTLITAAATTGIIIVNKNKKTGNPNEIITNNK